MGENGKIAYNASPAGTRIAYDCGAMVCAIDPDGSNHEFWHDNGMPLVALDWAPDATRLALVALSEDWGHPYLYWVATGADPPGGLINSDVSGGAAWSPDGSRIAFIDGWPIRTGGIQTVASDASGLALWLRVQPGIPSTPADEADIGLSGTVNDVRLASDLSDYRRARGAGHAADHRQGLDAASGWPRSRDDRGHPLQLPDPLRRHRRHHDRRRVHVRHHRRGHRGGDREGGQARGLELRQVAVHDANGDAFMRQGIFVP